MKSNSNDRNSSNHQWHIKFAEEALRQAKNELEVFSIPNNQSPGAANKKLAEAALKIGFIVINEVGGLLTQSTVQESRDNILAWLSDVLCTGYEDGPHLGHDIVDAIAEALGEVPDRAESTYD